MHDVWTKIASTIPLAFTSAYNNSQSPDIFRCLSGQNKFDLTHLLYIINGKVSVFLEDKVMSGQISTLIISTALPYNPKCEFIKFSASNEYFALLLTCFLPVFHESFKCKIVFSNNTV